MKRKQTHSVKREQKKSFLLKEISALVRQLAADESELSSLFVTKIELSKDTGICYVYFSTYTDKSAFDKGLELLKLYKPSMRKALAQAMHTRYVPDLIFRYDTAKEKERRVTDILNTIRDEKGEE